LSKKSHARTVFLNVLLLAAMFTLLMTLSPNTPFSSASPESSKYSVSVNPARIQEGLDTNITVGVQEASVNATYTLKVNVTAPTGYSYVTKVSVTTNENGFGTNLTKFWSDFAASANTSYVGLYKIYVNETLATSNFTVGLTDKLRYLRSESVNIRGAGFKANETVQINLKFSGGSVTGFPKNMTASPSGVVIDYWVIPADAPLGVYTLTLANATTGGTVKSPPDVQDFTIEGICEIQTLNLANQTVANVIIEAYNSKTGGFLNLRQGTNGTGWVRFTLATGNYTFKAFWRSVEVGVKNISVTGNIMLPFKVDLSNIKLTVIDETSTPLPFINLSLEYNYTTRAGTTFPEKESFTTNFTGSGQIRNVFTNISYIIEARRYGFLFNTTSIKSLPAISWNNITIIAPTYTMFVRMLDSKDAPAVGLKVSAYEWTSGISEPLQQAQTDSNGNVTFSLTVGRYRLRVDQDITFVNDFTVDLVQNPSFLVVRMDVYNVDLRVLVIDYFGQPIPNVSVELQRKNDSGYEMIQTKTTGSNGIASFNSIIGGNSRVYVSVAGRPGEIQYLYLVGPTEDAMFKMDGYIAVAGYALETSQFVTMVILLILIIAFIVASTYKRLRALLQRRRQ